MGSMFDDYKDLIEFVPENKEGKEGKELIVKLLYETWLFNKSVDSENEPLALFMPIQCHRVASAIKIQSVFRGYLFRKQTNDENGLTFNDQIVQRRAIIHIQKWWQWYKIRGRIAAISKIKNYLKKIDSSSLFIEENLYVNLKKITDDTHARANFPEQKLDFDFMEGYGVGARQKP